MKNSQFSFVCIFMIHSRSYQTSHVFRSHKFLVGRKPLPYDWEPFLSTEKPVYSTRQIRTHSPVRLRAFQAMLFVYKNSNFEISSHQSTVTDDDDDNDNVVLCKMHKAIRMSYALASQMHSNARTRIQRNAYSSFPTCSFFVPRLRNPTNPKNVQTISYMQWTEMQNT